MKHLSCCFTGHRIIPQDERDRVIKATRAEVEKLIKDGVCLFYAGGALGFDTIAAAVVIGLREKYEHIRLILALPCKNQTLKWNDSDIRVYENIKARCDDYIYISEMYTPGCMHKRNRYMVDNSAYCICYLKEDSGGTAYTVTYAEKSGIEIIYI